MPGLGGIHPLQLIIVLVLVLLLFGGRGRISSIMSDAAKGIRSFRSGLKDDEKKAEEAAKLDDEGTINVTPPKEEAKQKDS